MLKIIDAFGWATYGQVVRFVCWLTWRDSDWVAWVFLYLYVIFNGIGTALEPRVRDQAINAFFIAVGYFFIAPIIKEKPPVSVRFYGFMFTRVLFMSLDFLLSFGYIGDPQAKRLFYILGAVSMTLCIYAYCAGIDRRTVLQPEAA